jgi:hypothetical protein
MEIDFNRFNASGPAERAEMIVRAGSRARGRAAPKLDEPIKIEDDNPESLAAAICLAGRRARGQK